MRQEYWQLAWRQLKAGHLNWLMQQVYKKVAIKRGARRGKALCGPLLGSILITYRCDNRCLMCEYPQEAVRRKGEGDVELSEKEMWDLVEDFKAIGSASVSLTGGEPLIRKDVFRLLHRTKELGMMSNINSNGNLLSNPDLSRQLVETGVDLINISVDGATAATHDHLRGVAGGFDKLVNAIDTMQGQIRELKSPSLINMVTVISVENLPEVPRILDLARRLKVNRLGFIPVHQFDFMKENLQTGRPEWMDELEAVITLLKQEVKNGLVDNSVEYLDLFKNCFLGETLPIPCLAAYTSMMVNTYGEMFPCFPWIEKKQSVGNIRQTPLRDFWDSDDYNRQRQTISVCRDCFWNCHTELNLALK